MHGRPERITRLLLGALVAILIGGGSVPLARADHAPTKDAQTTTLLKSLPAERIDAAVDKYDQWLDEVDARNDTAGLATAIVVHDHVRYERTLGHADADTGEPVKPNTVFRLASLSKAFATGMAGLLVEQGRLDWSDRLANILPYFRLQSNEATRDATIRDIAGQKLGLPRNSFDNRLEADERYTTLVRQLYKIDPVCPVGDCYSYQNIAFSMLGDIIHARTGKFFGHVVAQHLFRPLGMITASYGRSGLEHSDSWARPHRYYDGQWHSYEPNLDYYRVGPAAGVNASIRDMEQWLKTQMGHRSDVLSSDLLASLHAPGINTPGETRSTPWRRARVKHAHYALGWRVYDYAGHRLIFHAGAVSGYRTEIAFMPEYDIGMVIMWNSTARVPAGLLPMLLDRLLKLPSVDWAGLDGKRRHAG